LIEHGIADWVATGAKLVIPYYLALKAEALHHANRSPEALEAISEAEALAERPEERCWCAELHRLRGVFLAATGAEELQIEASFSEAIRIAKEQKSISLEKRAEATYAEYRRQKASGSGERGFRGHPLKFIWLRVGNCQTSLITSLLRSRYQVIGQFIESETESLLVP
jgi:hypothetical protein